MQISLTANHQKLLIMKTGLPRFGKATKRQLIMGAKLTVILITAACLQVSAGTIAQKLTLSVTNVPLKKVFTAITRQTGYSFIYTDQALEKSKPVTLNFQQAELPEVLDLCFKDQPLTYTIVDKLVVVKQRASQPAPPLPALVQQQHLPLQVPSRDPLEILAIPPFIRIHGRVTDEAGNPLQGAYISMRLSEKLFRSTMTDKNGEFVLMSTTGNETITISSIGYETQEFRLTRQTELTVRLRIKIVVLQDVKVSYSTGYQTLSKERATGSFAKPDMETFQTRVGTMDIVNRLDGLVPGLTITAGPKGVQTSSYNGNGNSTQASVLRGISTVAAGMPTSPLMVLNGVVVTDYSTVNPDDIADITVLKDAAAAAIWGARAADGVIVVTTKTSLKDQKLRVSYSGFVNFQGKPDFNYNPVLNSKQYIQAAREIFDPVAYPWNTLYSSFIAPHEVILYNQYRGLISAATANAELDSLASIDNMGQIKDLWYNNALTTNHTVAASGGGNAYSFYASLSYTDTKSNQPGATNNAYRININQELNPNKNIRISLNASLNNTIAGSQRPISISNGFLPYQLFLDAQGKQVNLPYMTGWSDSLRLNYQARSRINLDYYPINEINYGSTKSNNLSFNVTANVSVKLWKGLSFQGAYAYLKAPGSNTTYDDIQSLSMRKELLNYTVAPTIGSTPVYYLPTTGGRYQTGNNDQRNWDVRNQLVYNLNAGQGRHLLTVQLGQEAQEAFSSRTTSVVRGYNKVLNTYTLLNYATLNQGIFGAVSSGRSIFTEQPYTYSESLSRFNSYFGLASYTLHAKYSVDASWRQDHSNLFGQEKSSQNKPSWSFGGKWQIAREDFMKRATWVNELGLRVTYGITGNSPYVGAASIYDILAGQTSSTTGNALSISKPANNKLAWETTHTTNIGIDFSLFHNRVSGGIDFYGKNTTDLLGSSPLDPFSGYSSATANLGKLTNKGIEISIKTVNLQTKQFTWSTSFVFSYNKNKLVSYVALNPLLNTASTKVATNSYYVGYSMSPLFAFRFAGLDNLGDPRIRLANGTVTKDPAISQPADIKYMGTTQPVFNGGLTNTFRYKNISLSVNMIYSLGNVMRRDVNSLYSGRLASSASFSSGNTSAYFVNRWKKPGDEAFTDIPSYVASSYLNYSRRNVAYYTQGDINVVSASYAKIRDLTLSYSLPAGLLRRMKTQGVTVYGQATNFMVWKANHDNIDPEYQGFATGARGIPPYKHSYSLGVNISF